MVRVCPVSQSDAAESSSFLKVDPRKKQITIMDPSANHTPSTVSQKRAGASQVPPKMFTFDAAFPPDASQVKATAVRRFVVSVDVGFRFTRRIKCFCNILFALFLHLPLLLGGGVRRNGCRGDSVRGEWSRWLCLLLRTLQAG